jgi:hypothetical protein
MSTVDRVSQWSHRIFNTTANEQNVRRESVSNPFAKSNFQKNILTEDVFESTKKKGVSFTGLNNGITQGTKRIYSTFVGSINDFGKRFYEGIESIKEFCRGIKNGIVSAYNKIQEIGNTEVHIGEGIKHGYESIKNVLSYDVTSIFNTRGKNVAKMAKMDPHTEVKPMLIDSIEALASDMAKISEAA